MPPVILNGKHIVSPLSFRTYDCLVHLSRRKVAVHYLFKKYCTGIILYFIHWYIIIKHRSSSIMVKSPYCCGSYGPFSIYFGLNNGFFLLSFENNNCIEIVFYTQVYNQNICQLRFKVKLTNYCGSYSPFCHPT